VLPYDRQRLGKGQALVSQAVNVYARGKLLGVQGCRMRPGSQTAVHQGFDFLSADVVELERDVARPRKGELDPGRSLDGPLAAGV